MNVYDFAMKMEEDGKAYYERMAQQTDHKGLETIFRRLAEDEQKHYETFRQLKSGSGAPSMQDTTILEDARNIFETLSGSTESPGKAKSDLDAYQKAMKLEADSFALYEDAAEKEENGEVKKILLRVADEEHKHFNILSNIYHFVNAPNEYLAWREFSNLDEFHQFGRDVDE